MTYVFCDEINNTLLINLFYILLIFLQAIISKSTNKIITNKFFDRSQIITDNYFNRLEI
jgi:hypothetical protein